MSRLVKTSQVITYFVIENIESEKKIRSVMRSISHSIVPGTKICLIFPQFQNYTILGQSELNHIIILFKKIMRSYIRLFKISDVKYIMPRFYYYVFEKN